MSKCPDAHDAEATILTAMEHVWNKVRLNFTYVTSYGPSSDDGAEI